MDTLLLKFYEFLEWSKWLLLLAVSLVFADLYFGLRAATVRREKIKRSRALRRTFDKLFGYILWVIITYFMGKSIGEKVWEYVPPMLILVIIYGIEFESCLVNYYAIRGKKVKVKFQSKSDFIKIEEDDKNKQEF